MTVGGAEANDAGHNNNTHHGSTEPGSAENSPAAAAPASAAPASKKVSAQSSTAGEDRPNYVLKYTLKGHQDSVSSVRFSPDGLWLATACKKDPLPAPYLTRIL